MRPDLSTTSDLPIEATETNLLEAGNWGKAVEVAAVQRKAGRPTIGRMVDQPEPYCFLFALHQRCASSTPLQSRRWWMSPPLTQHLGIKNAEF